MALERKKNLRLPFGRVHEGKSLPTTPTEDGAQMQIASSVYNQLKERGTHMYSAVACGLRCFVS
eukprot:1052650-Pelagomonas_calceolata.AAC.1